MPKEKKGGLLGALKQAAVEGGWLSDSSETAVEKPVAAPVTAPTIISPQQSAAGQAVAANPALVDQLRKIALAPANSPLTNTFLRHLEKARSIDPDPIKATKIALTFSDIPVSDLVREIESAIAANLAGHKMSFESEVATRRADINSKFDQEQQALEKAIAEDQATAESIRVRLAENTAKLSNLSADQASAVAKVEKTKSEADASLAVVESEIQSLLTNLKSA